MCGIAGTVRFSGNAVDGDREVVSRMLALQQNRGPDGNGIRMDGPVVLGHLRLSIIDLRETAGQPMSNETGDVWVTYNGEVYNYRELTAELKACGHVFRTTSDTEVLVHGYEQWGGDGLVRRLRGMFAFAIYDSRAWQGENSNPFFFAARDRLGIKPFYYGTEDGRVAFASQARALSKSGAVRDDLDRSAVASFLCLGSVPFPRTCLKGVQCLPPGHSLTIDRNGAHVSKYWELSYNGATAETIETILQDSVNRHLVADVPVGVFLSGGVDSAGIAYLAARNRTAPVRTLTISFDEKDFSEAAYAKAFADAFGTDHHEIRVTSKDFEDEIPRYLESVDQPTADGVNTYFVSRAARQMGLKVVLSGLGGDEVFFGYKHYRQIVSPSGLLGTFLKSGDLVRRMAGYGASLYGMAGGGERWERFDYFGGRTVNESLYLLLRGFFPPSRASRLLGISQSELKQSVNESFEAIHQAGQNGHVDPNQFHYIEMKRYLHDQLLRDSDVFSMAHSLELRVPLLDDPLVEAGCRIPAAEKITAGINKPKLVEGLGHEIIREAAARPKQGFTFPFAQWMKAKADEFEERALGGGLLDRAAVRDCWKAFRVGQVHWSRAWSTVVLASLSNS